MDPVNRALRLAPRRDLLLDERDDRVTPRHQGVDFVAADAGLCGRRDLFLRERLQLLEELAIGLRDVAGRQSCLFGGTRG